MNLVNNITESLKQSVADAAAAAKAAGKINFEDLPQFVLIFLFKQQLAIRCPAFGAKTG